MLLVIYEGASGNPAVAQDVESYAQAIDYPNFPIFADGNSMVAGATPLTNEVHPEMCAIGPNLELIKCYSGHGGHEDALNDIRAHAGL